MRTTLLSIMLALSGCTAASHACEAPVVLGEYTYSATALGGSCGELIPETFVPYNPENCVFHWSPVSETSCDFDVARDCQSVEISGGGMLRFATVTGSLSAVGASWEGTMHVEGLHVGTNEPCSGDYAVTVAP